MGIRDRMGSEVEGQTSGRWQYEFPIIRSSPERFRDLYELFGSVHPVTTQGPMFVEQGSPFVPEGQDDQLKKRKCPHPFVPADPL